MREGLRSPHLVTPIPFRNPGCHLALGALPSFACLLCLMTWAPGGPDVKKDRLEFRVFLPTRGLGFRMIRQV